MGCMNLVSIITWHTRVPVTLWLQIHDINCYAVLAQVSERWSVSRAYRAAEGGFMRPCHAVLIDH